MTSREMVIPDSLHFRSLLFADFLAEFTSAGERTALSVTDKARHLTAEQVLFAVAEFWMQWRH